MVEPLRRKSVRIDRILGRMQTAVRYHFRSRFNLRRIYHLDELDARHHVKTLPLELRIVAFEEMVDVRVAPRIVRRGNEALVPASRIRKQVLSAVAHHRRIAVDLLAERLRRRHVEAHRAGNRRILPELSEGTAHHAGVGRAYIGDRQRCIDDLVDAYFRNRCGGIALPGHRDERHVLALPRPVQAAVRKHLHRVRELAAGRDPLRERIVAAAP